MPRPAFGQILFSYPPFLVRQLIVEGLNAFPHYVLPQPVITMPFRGEEHQITSTYDARADLPWVIYALRRWLVDRPRIIRCWEDHLAFLQQPEEMARLEADLEAEWMTKQEAERRRQNDTAVDHEPRTSRTRVTAEQVLARQRDELERIRQLTHEVEQGLQALEAAHPEAVAALDEVAGEIEKSRAQTAKRVRSRRKSQNGS